MSLARKYDCYIVLNAAPTTEITQKADKILILFQEKYLVVERNSIFIICGITSLWY